ncbi:uncharacterized protein T16H12.9-like [Rhopilema esculentum]|uniref:uncharacterized protein T16H12.9-like n=1 Tax=Rhopilema esculentum TaxID=499914 RepID=UPI0031DFDCB0
MHFGNKALLAILIAIGVAEAIDAACQAQSTSALKKMLLSAGGTLNPQMVAVDEAGARLFKSHFSTKDINVQRVRTLRKRKRDGKRDFEEDVIMEDEDIEEDDNDDRKKRRKRRSTTLGSCYGPGVPLNNMYLLCHTCDSTTVLSSDYFPRYVNEVICNPNKTPSCFHGQGQCTSNSVPIVFLKKTGNCVTSGSGILLEEWMAETINIRTCCECRLYPGSFLIPFTI